MYKEIEKIKADPIEIIYCYYCTNPAVHLDQFWPYHNELTYCKEHRGAWL